MEALNQACDAAGGVSAIASQIGVTQQAVSNWKKRGNVPAFHCAAIEKATSGAVRRWHLRPDDWHRIWPELIGTPGAPAVAEAKAG